MPRDEIRRIFLYSESIRMGPIRNSLTNPKSRPGDGGGGANEDAHDGSRNPHGPSGSSGGDTNTRNDGTGVQGPGGSDGGNAGGAAVTSSCAITTSDDHPLSYEEVDDTEDCETASSISMDQIVEMTIRQAPAFAPYFLEQQNERAERTRRDIFQWLANC